MPIEQMPGGGQVITGNAISYFRLLSLRGALKLEVNTKMRSRINVAEAVRQTIGSKTKKKEKLLAELQAYIDQHGETLARS